MLESVQSAPHSEGGAELLQTTLDLSGQRSVRFATWVANVRLRARRQPSSGSVLDPLIDTLLLHAAWVVLPQSTTSRGLADAVVGLPPRRRVVVDSLIHDGMDLEEAAGRLGISEREAAIRLARSMMQISEAGSPSDHDEDVGRWLAVPGSVAERDRVADRLVAAGIDPLVLHDLEDTYRRLRALPRRAWTSVSTSSHRPTRSRVSARA